jgi:hypothetical protein
LSQEPRKEAKSEAKFGLAEKVAESHVTAEYTTPYELVNFVVHIPRYITHVALTGLLSFNSDSSWNSLLIRPLLLVESTMSCTMSFFPLSTASRNGILSSNPL